MKKLLLMTNAYPSEEKKYAGIFVKNQAEWLIKNTDFDVKIFALKRRFTSKIGSLRKYFFSYLRFLTHLPNRYDVLHIHFLSPLILLPFVYSFFHPETKIVMTLHGSGLNRLNNRFLISVYKYLIRCVDVLICVGESMRDTTIKKLDRKTDYVLCAGIDTSVIYSEHKPYSERDIDFLYVGSFYKVKGVDRFIRALELLKSENFKITFIGSGNYGSELEKLSTYFDLQVIRELEQNALNNYYNRSKFFVFPSRSEGFGLALAEATYCNTPAIVSDLKQLQYQIKDNWNGYVCNNTTPRKLAETLKGANGISAAEWDRLSKNAKKNADKYTLDYVCRELLTIYH